MSSGWGKMHWLWQSQSRQQGAHSPGLRLVRKFSFLTLLTKKPYFVNVFSGVNLSPPSRVFPIPTRLSAFPLLRALCWDTELGPGPAGGETFCELPYGEQSQVHAQLMGALEGLRCPGEVAVTEQETSCLKWLEPAV